MNLKSSLIDRLRLASILDGVSWIALAGVAMPLKYIGGNEIGVKIIGPLHGVFFILLCYFLLMALIDKKLSFKWCVIVFLCALIPFAPFFLDPRLKRFSD